MIPNVIHFCFGLSPDHGGKPFSLVHYLAVRSAVETNRPETVLFHYRYEPTGEWWERARPYLDLHPVEPLAALYGVPNPHYAHQADYIRLSALHEHGGIYLDMDVLCLRSFEPLRRHETVLGEEGKDGFYGLCNAVILSAPGSWFVSKWLEGFDPNTSLWKGFRSTGHDAYWNELSVRYPAYLARLYPARPTSTGSPAASSIPELRVRSEAPFSERASPRSSAPARAPRSLPQRGCVKVRVVVPVACDSPVSTQRIKARGSRKLTI